jgi:hypothetical protein
MFDEPTIEGECPLGTTWDCMISVVHLLLRSRNFLISPKNLVLMCHNNIFNIIMSKHLEELTHLMVAFKSQLSLSHSMYLNQLLTSCSIRDRKLDKKLSTYKSAILQALASLHRLASSSDTL